MSDIDTLSLRELLEIVEEHPDIVLGLMDIKNADTLASIDEAWARVHKGLFDITKDRLQVAVVKMSYERRSAQSDLRIEMQGGIV